MSNVTFLADHAEVDLSPSQVLQRALEAQLSGALVLGVRDDGSLYFETSIPDGGECVWLMEKVKHVILRESFL